MRRLTGYDLYALAQLAPIAIICALAGRAVMPFTPWAGWTMWALSASSGVVAFDILLGAPALRGVADIMHSRRSGNTR